jgi:hypothetical protein
MPTPDEHESCVCGFYGCSRTSSLQHHVRWECTRGYFHSAATCCFAWLRLKTAPASSKKKPVPQPGQTTYSLSTQRGFATWHENAQVGQYGLSSASQSRPNREILSGGNAIVSWASLEPGFPERLLEQLRPAFGSLFRALTLDVFPQARLVGDRVLLAADLTGLSGVEAEVLNRVRTRNRMCFFSPEGINAPRGLGTSRAFVWVCLPGTSGIIDHCPYF